MLCPKCGYEIDDRAEYCPYCGSSVRRSGAREAGYSEGYQDTGYQRNEYQDAGYQRNEYRRRPQPAVVTLEDLPPELRPMGAWGYVGWGILFAIPVVGFILVIVFSFVSGNINRKRFARSYICWYLIGIIVAAVLLIAGVITWNGFFNGQNWYWPFR